VKTRLDLGIDNATVHRVRKSRVADATPATITGRDGKTYLRKRISNARFQMAWVSFGRSFAPPPRPPSTADPFRPCRSRQARIRYGAPTKRARRRQLNFIGDRMVRSVI
jgi:hypothetical protein